MARITSPRTANALGHITLPGAACGDSSEKNYWFAAPTTFHAWKAVMMRDLIDPNDSNASSIVKKLHVIWGHASAPQLKRILTDADGVGEHCTEGGGLRGG